MLTGNPSNLNEQATKIQCFIYGNMRILLSAVDLISLSCYTGSIYKLQVQDVYDTIYHSPFCSCYYLLDSRVICITRVLLTSMFLLRICFYGNLAAHITYKTYRAHT